MTARAVLILHGWQGSTLDHWQTWLARELRGDSAPTVLFPSLLDPDTPQVDVWAAALHTALAQLAKLAPPGGRRVCCHSLGSTLWMREAPRIAPAHHVAAVALVAPPSALTEIPEVAPFVGFTPDAAATAAASDTTRLVCSDNDPHAMGRDPREEWAAPAGIPSELLPGAGHVNPDAGFGPWPAMAAWARGERETVADPGPDSTREIAIEGEMIRLGQLLKLVGLAQGGGEVKALLAQEGALVNGEPEQRRGRQLHPGDVIVVVGETLALTSR